MSDVELEALRLVLSTYRDGSGQYQDKRRPNRTVPGGFNFERALAAVLQGRAPENKGIFDVIVDGPPQPFGISCKSTQFRAAKHLSSFMELSNAAAKFRNHLLELQIHWATEPTLAGPALVDLVTSWHLADTQGVSVEASRYAVLAHDSSWLTFQLSSFPLTLKTANPRGDVEWVSKGKALAGFFDDDGRRHLLWEVYPNSGGQMKYYPLLKWADWTTSPFVLEDPPGYSLIQKAADYFPALWPEGWPEI